MSTPLKGLFSAMLKFHSPVKNPNWWETNRLAIYKAPGITEDKFIQSFRSPSRGFEPGSSAFKSPTQTTEPRCLRNESTSKE